MDALLYLAIGLGLGLVTSMPIGVANAAVVDAAVRSGRRRARALAAGGATADLIHAGLAFAGLGPLLAAHPPLPAIFFAISGIAIIVYGVHVMRATPARVVGPGDGRVAGAYAVGLLLTATNPAALAAWMMVAGAIAPSAPLLGVAVAIGVGTGAFTWFAVLAELAHRGRDLLTRRGQLVSRVIGAVLIVLGALSLFRGAHQLAT
ncbi:MAG TPA: LysE family transporter [Kofleriaceae bacterium]|nr:LysE family transporter [Kofleriaceae bacterium]